MRVWVHSEFNIFAEGLVLLLETLGLRPTLQLETQCEVALWDLTSSVSPFPPPPSLPTLALITGGDADAVLLLKQHYRGYLRVGDDCTVLKRALEAVRRGEIWADRKILTQALDSFKTPTLTSREQATLHLLIKGLSNRGIATQLGIAEGTVKMHVSRLFDKLEVKSRAELISFYKA
jgi:DNA-binding NarL/FixJ family response regulator